MELRLELRIPTCEAAETVLARHTLQSSTGRESRCRCGWTGIDWREHRDAVIAAWLERERRAWRARLLAEEGVEQP
jgi:hypothetical protein